MHECMHFVYDCTYGVCMCMRVCTYLCIDVLDYMHIILCVKPGFVGVSETWRLHFKIYLFDCVQLSLYEWIFKWLAYFAKLSRDRWMCLEWTWLAKTF